MALYVLCSGCGRFLLDRAFGLRLSHGREREFMLEQRQTDAISACLHQGLEPARRRSCLRPRAYTGATPS